MGTQNECVVMRGILPDKLTVIVTGGAGGIGAATARLLAGQGAKVLIADILDEKGNQISDEIGDNARYCSLDVTNVSHWEAAVALAEKEFGSVNALFNNSGIISLGTVLDCTPEEFRRIIDVNLTGIFLGIHSVSPAITRSGGGVIVNTSSTAGLQGFGGLAAYVASKWGVRGLTKAAALDLATSGIRVVSIHPGPIATPMTEDLSSEMTAAQPIPRFGEAEEVARMVQFLMTEATFSTGSEFVIDGGQVTGQILELEGP